MELLSSWLGNGAGERMKAPITNKQLLEMMWDRFPEIMKRGVEQPAQQEPESECNPQDLCAGCRCKYAEQPAQQEPVTLEEYDAGLLSNFGGGNVYWWWDYIRAELGRAYEHYQSQMLSPPAQRKPLTREVINRDFYGRIDFVRLIEAAHGIKENT